MYWLLKKTKRKRLPRCSSDGSALPIVLFFAAIGMITVFTYLTHQFSFSRGAFSAPTSLQAMLNARSGIYKAFYLLIDSTATDTLKTISTLDSAFGADMFGEFPDSLPSETDKPQFDGTPVEYILFENDSPAIGSCEVTLTPTGGSFALQSIGRYRSFEKTVTAEIGSRVPALPDTIVLYRNELPWDRPPSNGTVVSIPDTKQVNTSWYNKLNDRYLTDLVESDTFLLDPPLIIQSSHDIKKIDSIVQGPLLIDGSQLTVVWNDTVTILIKGDLQITGEAEITGLTFIVAGEIKILDEAVLKRCNLFTRSRLFIGDQARFSGNTLSMHSTTIYGRAVVENRSSMITGSTQSAHTTGSADSLKFSFLISEEASVDGVCIAVETPGSIKTDETTTVTGILWAQHVVCHRGRMQGLICAARLVDCDNPDQMVSSATAGIAPLPGDSTGTLKDTTHTPTIPLQNAITGIIEPLPGIALYHLPFFIGRLSILSWREK
jgi:hypothetical protein